MHYNWEKLPNYEMRTSISKLVDEVQAKFNCPNKHEIEVYHLPRWPRVFHFNCKYCHREVFIKSFGQDEGVSNEERRLRFNIERINLERISNNDLNKGSFSNGSFNIPKLISSIGFPHFALVMEYINSDYFSKVIINTIRNNNNIDLLNALSLLANFMVILHEKTIDNQLIESLSSLNDPLHLLNKFINIDEYEGILTQLYSLHAKWIEDNFFKKNLLRCLAHDGLSLVNVLYSSHNRQINITDFETMHYDTPFVDIGTVTAELKLSFMINAGNSYLAEPYISYFLREYFVHQNIIDLTYRQFTWVQSYFMGRRLIIIAPGKWVNQSLKKWCLAGC